MRANLIRGLLLVVAAAAVAVALALAAASQEPSEAGSSLRMPAQTGRSVVQLHPAPGRPESSPGPVVRAPQVQAVPRTPAAPAPPRKHRPRIVVLPGVILTRAAPVKPAVKVIPVRRKPVPTEPATRELAEADVAAAELLHDRPAPPRPHE
jgi:hypothetical protein